MRKIKITFIGCDGSGKTSLINYLKENLEMQNKTVDVIFLGWRDFNNPLLKLFSKIYLKNKFKKSNLKEKKLARFRPRGWFFYLVYYSELWLRYVKIILSKKEYILIDRYFYDELAFAEGLKFKSFKIITPKPNLCFLLKASQDTLKKRGETISDKILENFYSRMERLSFYFPMIRIDSSKSLHIVYKKIKSMLNSL